MKAGQSTDDAAAWRCSFGAYVPPDFDLFDFDLGALGVVHDLCSWRGHQGYPANKVALSWTCGSHKILVATGLLNEMRCEDPRAKVLQLARSGRAFDRSGEPANGEVVGRVAAEDALWGPWVVPVDSGSL